MPSRSDGPSTWPVRHTRSAGGVVVRTTPRGAEVAMIRTRSRTGDEVWGLPKGLPEDGEDDRTAAVREVREETGLEAEIIDHIDDVTYWFAWAPDRARYRKTVAWFLMREVGGRIDDHDDEVDEVRFVPLGDAPARATYDSDRRILRRAAEMVSTR